MIDCCFCEGDPRKADALRRRTGWKNEDFFVTPTVGELGPDHLLVIPRAHIPSFGHLSRDHALEAERIIDTHSALLSDERTKVIVFEHGMVSHSAAGGCGISHAHVHLVSVPRAFEIGPLPEPNGFHPWTPVSPGEFLSRANQGSGYLLIGCEGTFWTRQVENLPSQYLRRWIAGRLGKAQWDWREATDVDVERRARDLRERHSATTVGTTSL
jgi:diadenosine tetraphosphate (Ap4A) HIT family hydrolase